MSGRSVRAAALLLLPLLLDAASAASSSASAASPSTSGCAWGAVVSSCPPACPGAGGCVARCPASLCRVGACLCVTTCLRPCAGYRRTTSTTTPRPRYSGPSLTWKGLIYGCGCHLVGSEGPTCDIVSGQCKCRPGVEGRTCDRCQVGRWGLTSLGRCERCDCDPLGAVDASCDADSGRCRCRPGVGGRRCDTCDVGYFGFSSSGCRPCERCERPGHMCDPDTGRCVCPPLATGPSCDRCRPGAWGLETGKGCKACDCEAVGSVAHRCDEATGRCLCRDAYTGTRCDSCAPHHFGFPHCRRCGCHLAGTNPNYCDPTSGHCSCDASGQCPCKENAEGKQCSQCKEGTFGLSAENPDGCTRCFCFGRTTSCTQAGLTWSKIMSSKPRTLTVDYKSQHYQPPGTKNEIQVRHSDSQEQSSVTSYRHLNISNGLLIIPGFESVHLNSNFLWDQPLYWHLPAKFLGDRVLSYGGVLSFFVESTGNIKRPSRMYPLIQMQGNDRLILEYFPLLSPSSSHHGVRLHESLWKQKGSRSEKVSRELMMLTLQNVQHILIQASPFLDVSKAVLQNVALDTAVAAPGQPPPLARGIELCSCPPEYNSTSCQDPSIGFYRWYNKDPHQATIVIQIVGEARPCECRGRSNVCNIETGHCINCSHHTSGAHCERCADGFYGNPDLSTCQPCPCPSPHKNFALSCNVNGNNVICHCRPGYTGVRCDRCAYGWYGFPKLEGGSCTPCNCNPYGSVSDECDEEIGQCNCKVGITGRDCSRCQDRHVLTEFGCQSCNDSCTGVLLSEIEELAAELARNTHHIVNGNVPPPWTALQDIRKTADILEERLEELVKAVNRANNLPDDLIEELKRKAKLMLNKSKKLLKDSERNVERSGLVKQEAQDLLEEILKLQSETNDVVQGLMNYGQVEAGGISIEQALQEAHQLSTEIKKRNRTMESTKNMATNALGKCEHLLGEIQQLLDNNPDPSPLRHGLEKLNSRLNNLLSSLHNTSQVITKTRSLSTHSKERLQNTQTSIESILDLEGTVDTLSDEARLLVNNAASYLENATENMQLLEDNMNVIESLRRRVMEREGILYRLNPIYKDKYVLKAQEHADALYRQAQQYRDLFNSTRQDADFALKASRAYQEIVDALKTAHESAENATRAADIAYKSAYPDSEDASLVQRSKQVEEKSEHLLKKAAAELLKVKEVKKKFDGEKNKIKDLEETISEAKEGSNVILQELKKLHSDEILRFAEEAMRRAETALKISQETNNTAVRVSIDVQSKLRPLLTKLNEDNMLPDQDEKLLKAQLKIKTLTELLEKVNQKADDERRQNELWNNTIAAKLHNLRSKITQTRHTAEGIHLSLTSRTGVINGCVRSYKLHNLTPSTTNSILLSYAVHTDDKDASLFYLANNKSGEFMALEMVNRKIRFIWNAGGGVGVVVHPQKIEKAVLTQDKNWYRIEVKRTSNVAQLSVRQQLLPDGVSETERDGYPVRNTSQAGFGILDVSPGDILWVGGLPPNTVRPHYLHSSSRGLIGCLHQIVLDGRPLGLWNFATETADSCTACIAGVEESKDDDKYRFSGDGYSAHNVSSFDSSDKYQFSFILKFKTLDENALLFIAVDSKKERFIALLIENGHLVFHIGYGSNIELRIKTITKVNTGEWISCEALRHFYNGLEKAALIIEGEHNQSSPSKPPGEDDLPELAEYFLGGVPPGFQLQLNTKLHKLPNPFLGCMSDILVFNGGVNPLTGKFYGVEASCSVSHSVVSFQGNGYLHLPSHPLKRKKSSFEFVFRSLQPNAFLMLTKGSDDGDYYSASLVKGKVVIWVSSSGSRITLESETVLNDGEFHSISLSKQNRRLLLKVDERNHTSTVMTDLYYHVKVPEKLGGLYFGGVPYMTTAYNMIASNISLIGTIKDAIFNNELLRFENPVSFQNAAIGRLGPPLTSEVIEHKMPIPSVPTECYKVSRYTLESGAVKFGDAVESYVHMNLGRKSNFQKNFNLEFDFRTYYPNGLLFIAPATGKKPKQYIIVALRNKQLHVEVKGRRKIDKIISRSELNDGNWHNVVLHRVDRNLSLIVDHKAAESKRLPRKLNIGSSMYMGGLPQNGHFMPKVEVETLKGCIRHLKINKISEDLVGTRAFNKNVGQCFPTVERGSYFPGDAYAVYENAFQINNLQELELEFRTSELTGILLSVSEPSGSPAVSLELNNGKVVMRGDVGDGKPLHVEQTFPSKYTVCDNNWHSVHAVFLSNGLLLKVDNLPTMHGHSWNGATVIGRTNSPLYIGGIPDNSTGGTLQTREYFKGCIRNTEIGRTRKDWTDMAALENVLLNSCPVSL